MQLINSLKNLAFIECFTIPEQEKLAKRITQKTFLISGFQNSGAEATELYTQARKYFHDREN